MAEYRVFKLRIQTTHPWIVRCTASNPNEPDDKPDVFVTWREAMNFAYKWAGFTREIKKGFMTREAFRQLNLGEFHDREDFSYRGNWFS